MGTRVMVWSALGRTGTEVTHVSLDDGRLTATGTQIGTEPEAYRLDYRLETDQQLVTAQLTVDLRAAEWARGIDLVRDDGGVWTCEATTSGDPDLPPPGGDMSRVSGARDCDLGYSPLTNLMPVRREGLLDGGERDFLMAWVAVPSLQVLPSHQTYQHLRRDADGSVVRYTGRHRDFTGDLRFDRDGFVRLYPGLGLRRYPPVSGDDIAAAGPIP